MPMNALTCLAGYTKLSNFFCEEPPFLKDYNVKVLKYISD